MKIRVICYKLKKPIIYNKGTKWESQQDTFMAYETYKSLEEAKAKAEWYNTNKPNADDLGNPIDWNEVDYFYADIQEAI